MLLAIYDALIDVQSRLQQGQPPTGKRAAVKRCGPPLRLGLAKAPTHPDLRNQRLAERTRLTFGDGQGQDHAAHEEGPNGIRRRIHTDG